MAICYFYVGDNFYRCFCLINAISVFADHAGWFGAVLGIIMTILCLLAVFAAYKLFLKYR